MAPRWAASCSRTGWRRSQGILKVAHIPSADTLRKKLLSAFAPALKGAEFELEFAPKPADDIEEMGGVLEFTHSGNKEIDFVLKGNLLVDMKNYHRSIYVYEAKNDLFKEYNSFLNNNQGTVKHILEGSVPDNVRQALEAVGIIAEATP
jgi:hypothetical protein